jgi:hypothetical protein
MTMRLSSIPLLALLAAGAGGCVTNSQTRFPWSQPSQPSQPSQAQGYANPGQWTPLPQPGMAQPGMAAPYGQYGQYTPYAPGPYGAPQQQQPAFPQLQPVFRPVNVQALLALQGRVPCAPKEVAPGTWATFDCAPFQAISQAMQYIPFVRFNFLPAGPAPAAVDHRTEGNEGPIKDQGAVGACTAMSLSSAMDNAIRRLGRQDVVSPLHLWSRYGVGITGQAGDSNVGKAVALEQTWAYDPVKACKISKSPMDTCGVAYGVSSSSEAFDPGLKAEHATADASGRYQLAKIEQLHAKPANLAELTTVLAGGDDVWISFSVNDQAWMARNLQNAVIPDYETVDDTGHAVVLAGYRTLPNGTKQFLIHNSWSARWGENGYGWISEAMVTKYTRAAYRVRVADARGGSAPSVPAVPGSPLPVPGAPGAPAPSGGDCPAGQVQEPVFGTCVPGGLPGFPGAGGQGPAPTKQGPPPQGSCPAGQVPDMMSGGCVAACPGGSPAVGGMCLPFPSR